VHSTFASLVPRCTAARIICTTRTGQQNPGLRMSPHFYNAMDEMRAAADFIKQEMKA
jgi:selenocysteine lyase/cysteine desulfurase